VEDYESIVVPKLMVPLKMCGERENGNGAPAGIGEKDRTEPSAKIIEKSPVKTLPSG
jgi:hypothetical protein